MNCKITTTPDFARELKHLAKRYPSMKDDFKKFIDELRASPIMGTDLVAIYDKSEQANITDKELRQLIKKNGLF